MAPFVEFAKLQCCFLASTPSGLMAFEAGWSASDFWCSVTLEQTISGGISGRIFGSFLALASVPTLWDQPWDCLLQVGAQLLFFSCHPLASLPPNPNSVCPALPLFLSRKSICLADLKGSCSIMFSIAILVSLHDSGPWKSCFALIPSFLPHWSVSSGLLGLGLPFGGNTAQFLNYSLHQHL